MGKWKRRTPSVMERRRSALVQTLPSLHTRTPRARPAQRTGPPEGCPHQGWPGPPQEGLGVSPSVPLPTRRALCLPHSLPHLPPLRSPPAPHIPRIPSRVSPRVPGPCPHPHTLGSTSLCPVTHQTSLAHAHSPCNTHLRGPAFSDVPSSGGAEPSLSPIFFCQGMRFFSLCAGQRREPFLGLSWDREWGCEFGLDRSNSAFTARVRSRSAWCWAGVG